MSAVSELKMFCVVLSLLQVVSGTFSGDSSKAAILDETRSFRLNGSSGVAYTQEDGTRFKETTAADGERKGSYQYVGDDGRTYVVEYLAGVNGFQIVRSEALGESKPVEASKKQWRPAAAPPAPPRPEIRSRGAGDVFSFNYGRSPAHPAVLPVVHHHQQLHPAVVPVSHHHQQLHPAVVPVSHHHQQLHPVVAPVSHPQPLFAPLGHFYSFSYGGPHPAARVVFGPRLPAVIATPPPPATTSAAPPATASTSTSTTTTTTAATTTPTAASTTTYVHKEFHVGRVSVNRSDSGYVYTYSHNA